MADSELREFITRHSRLLVITGAGCSTDSGIPDYRDATGAWKRAQPVTYQAFVGSPFVRQRYWARSLLGWRRFRHAEPNTVHRALAVLERQERVEQLVTQNVDRLHQAAGSRGVIDLHGRLDLVRCLECELRTPREQVQWQLLEDNPGWDQLQARIAPDGDADLEGADFEAFVVPTCPRCAGMLKPDVVFFGEGVPPTRVEAIQHHLRRADAVLIVGSSLMVYSGFRFVRDAARMGLPIAAVNLGKTRADSVLTLKIEQLCGEALGFLLDGQIIPLTRPMAPRRAPDHRLETST